MPMSLKWFSFLVVNWMFVLKPMCRKRRYRFAPCSYAFYFQGPVLVITFLSQQIMSVRDAKGVVVEGDPEKVLRVMYVWVLCRDQTELDPKAAWRLLELSANSTEQFLWSKNRRNAVLWRHLRQMLLNALLRYYSVRSIFLGCVRRKGKSSSKLFLHL